MNKTYRLVFNRELRVMQVASELAGSRSGDASGTTGHARRRPHLAASVLAACLSLGAVSTAWAQEADYAAIFDDDYVMDPDTAANYDWDKINVWGMIVGLEDDGHVIVRDGLLVESAGVILGSGAGVSGQMDLIGPGTTLTEGYWSGEPVYVGYAGNGLLNVLDGAKVVDMRWLYVAQEAGSEGTVNVDGAGSEMGHFEMAVVGRRGNGTLDITNGGKVSVGNIDAAGVSVGAGQYEGSTGTILVDGAGSLLEVSGNEFIVGDAGQASLTVTQGGSVDSRALWAGADTTGVGTIEVAGEGSRITASSMSVGRAGAGDMVIRDGAAVATDASGLFAGFSLGHGATGKGTLLVEGAGSSLAVAGSRILVGYGGEGSMTVRDGASVTAGAVSVAYEAAAQGTLHVTGADTQLAVDGGLTVGHSGKGSLEVLDGATVSAGSAYVGYRYEGQDDAPEGIQGSALVSGTGSNMKVTGELVVAEDTTGSLLVDKGASVEAGSVRVERDEDDNSSDYAGELRITGAGTTFKAGEFDASTHFSLTDGAQLDTAGAGIRRNRTTLDGEKALVSGAETRWHNTGDLAINTAVDFVDGAQIATDTLTIGPSGYGDTSQPLQLTHVRILGEDTLLTTTGAVNVGAPVLGDTPGLLVLADGGHLQAGGDIRFGTRGMLAIGNGLQGDEDNPFAPAQAAGFFNPEARMVFLKDAQGASWLLLNHTEDDYVIANPLVSETYGDSSTYPATRITSVAGTTRLTGDASRFSDGIQVLGGRLVLDGDMNVLPADYDPSLARRYNLQLASVTGGELLVNGELGFEYQWSSGDEVYTGRTSQVEVSDAGVLGGNGTIIGNVELSKGGHLSPGEDGAGTLTIDGNLTIGENALDEASFFDVDVLGNGEADKLVVTGFADLNHGDSPTTVAVNALDPGTSYQDGQQYTILTAGGGVQGTFDKVLSNSAFLTPTLTYDANKVMLGVALNTSKADVVVRNGEVLSGNSDWASIEVQAGGTVSPGTGGERLGTIFASGPITFAQGSFYDVDIRGTGATQASATSAAAASGDGDFLTTSGTATLDGGTVRVTALDPQTSYRDGHTYTILTAEGGLSGTFEGALSRSAFLTPTLGYDAKNALLTIALKSDGGGGDDDGDDDGGTPTAPPIFETVAITRNQYNIARALDTLPQDGDGLALYNRLLMLSAQEARDAYGSLSGESHLATRSALLDDRFLREGIGRRLSGEVTESADAGVTAWVAGGASSGGIAGDFNASRTGYRQEGVMAGVDWALSDTLVLGAALGAADHGTRVAAWDSGADIGARHLGVYAQARWAGLAVRGGVSHAWYDVDSTRHATVAGTHVDRLDAGYDASATTVFAEGGWDLALGGALLTPYLALAHTRLETDGATEHGGITALDVAQSKDELLAATAGIRASWAVGGANGDDARLQAGLAWQNNSGELKPGQRARFVAGGDGFSVYGAPLARNLAVASVGLGLRTSDASQLSMDVQGRFGDGQHDGGAQLQWSWRF